jgi:hypothetical protein
MALIIEDGTIVAGAESYADIVVADPYHAVRGNTLWAGTDAEKEAALLRAMAHLEALPWRGDPVSGPVGAAGSQALSWPRSGVDLGATTWPDDEIPPGVVQSLLEAALVEIVSPGALAMSKPRGGQVKRQKVDVLETEWFEGAPSGTLYPAITGPLRGLLRGSLTLDVERG